MGSKKRKPNRGNPARSNGRPNERPARDEPQEGEAATWVVTEPTPDGKGWMAVIHFTEDLSISFTRELASEYAYVALAAAARAEYDAAVRRQLVSIKGLDESHAMQMVVDLRADRPPLSFQNLTFEAGVALADRKGFVTVSIDGESAWQWNPADIREHVSWLMESLVVADLDAAYLRALRGVVGLEEGVARTMIDALRRFR